MSRLLDSIALLDPVRRADLARTDAAIHYVSEQPSCIDCRVCGGDNAPGFCGLCQACRGLAATFAAREAMQ